MTIKKRNACMVLLLAGSLLAGMEAYAASCAKKLTDCESHYKEDCAAANWSPSQCEYMLKNPPQCTYQKTNKMYCHQSVLRNTGRLP